MTAPAFVAASTAGVQSSSISVPAPTGVASGDHQLIFIGVPSTTIAVTGVPSGWTLERSQQNPNDSTQFTLYCYKSTTATGSAAFTLSSSTTIAAVRVAYRGGGGVESSAGVADASSTSNHAIAQPTTTVADSMVVVGGYEDSAGTLKTHALSGYTMRGGDFNTSGLNRIGMLPVFDAVKASAGQVAAGNVVSSGGADYMAVISVVLAGVTGPAAPTVDAGADVAQWDVDTEFTRTATENANGATITAREWEITAGPAGVGTVLSTAAALAWTPTVTGTYTLTYSATNSEGTSSDSFTIAVTTPPVTPGTVFDLSYWHLTTPEDSGDGTALQIDQPELDSYVTDGFFVDGSGRLVMVAPVDGFSTSAASGATRMEFRQHLKGSYALAAIDPTDASGDRWQLTVTTQADPTSITGGSLPRQELIIGQIHGAGDSPIPLTIVAEWTSSGTPVTPRVRVFKNGPGVSNPLTNITTDTFITYRIRVQDAAVKLWVIEGQASDLPDPLTSTPTFEWPADSTNFTDLSGWYFKAGAYNKTEITSGSSGEGIAKISYLNVIEPGDPEESTSTTYDRTGVGAAVVVGSGAVQLDEPTTYDKTGGAAAVAAGAGVVELVPPAVHVRTGATVAVPAGTGALVFDEHETFDREGGAGAVAAGGGVLELDEPATFDRAGAAAAVAVGGGTRAVSSAGAYERDGAAAVVAAGGGALELDAHDLHDRAGAACAVVAGSGAVGLDSVTIYTLAGGAAAVAAGTGEADLAHDRTGAAGAVAAGSGAVQLSHAAVHERTGGGVAVAAGAGAVTRMAPGEHETAGGAVAVVAGSGSVTVTPPAVHDRAGGAAAVPVGAGGKQRVRSFTGGAAVVPAGTGAAELVPPAVHARTGAGVAVVGGDGALLLDEHGTHDRAGAAAAVAGGVGAVQVASATAHTRVGAGAAVAAGLALVEVIPPADYALTGAGAAVVVGGGFWRRGGRQRAGAPYRVGSWHAGRPVAVGRQYAGVPYASGQHHAGPETVT